MTARGHVKNGAVILEDGADLPEGSEVLVQTKFKLPPLQFKEVAESWTLASDIGKYIGCIDGMPEDFALNHDHCIHGSPSK